MYLMLPVFLVELSLIKKDDPATFNILVTDDSDYEISSVESINTKFFGWNILQVIQNTTPLFSQSVDGSHCGICAGTATTDGNDAEVTTNVDFDYKLAILLCYLTQPPNIDGIHKVTKLGSGTNLVEFLYR